MKRLWYENRSNELTSIRANHLKPATIPSNSKRITPRFDVPSKIFKKKDYCKTWIDLDLVTFLVS